MSKKSEKQRVGMYLGLICATILLYLFSSSMFPLFLLCCSLCRSFFLLGRDQTRKAFMLILVPQPMLNLHQCHCLSHQANDPKHVLKQLSMHICTVVMQLRLLYVVKWYLPRPNNLPSQYDMIKQDKYKEIFLIQQPSRKSLFYLARKSIALMKWLLLSVTVVLKGFK